jgi:hypothetical protein
METKVCSKCGIEKALSCFYRDKNRKDGFFNYCKDCLTKPYPKDLKINKLALNGKYECISCHKIKNFSEFHKSKQTKNGYCCQCKDCANLKTNEWYKNNKERAIQSQKEYHNNNRDKILEYQKFWRKNNPDNNKNYNKIHRKELSEKALIRQKRRYGIDINFTLTVLLRNRLYQALCGNNKSASTLELLGCSVKFLKLHLESQFTEDMSWENYGLGGWEIDHIYPCASFDLSKPLEQQICFHWSNLQPLWASDNRSKGAKNGLYYSN